MTCRGLGKTLPEHLGDILAQGAQLPLHNPDDAQGFSCTISSRGGSRGSGRRAGFLGRLS